jgi:hypothetical protein
MSISQTSALSKPSGTDKISSGTFTYFRARLKHRIYSLILKEFKASRLSKADLARRLGKDPAQLTRLLSGPGNLTVETTSDLLFAISGTELGLSSGDPFAKGKAGIPKSVEEALGAPISSAGQALSATEGQMPQQFVELIRLQPGSIVPAAPRMAA